MEDILRDIRDNSIKEAYFDTMKSLRTVMPYISTDEIIREIIKRPAPRFFISYENARRIVSLMSRGKTVRIANENKRRMYNDLYNAYMNCKSKMNIPGFCILKYIIEQEAPSYYVSLFTMRGIVYKSIKNR